MKARDMGMAMAVAAVLQAGAATAETTGGAWESRDPGAPRRHSFFMGLGYGPTTLKTADRAREVEGIDFRFSTDADDLGGIFYAGYWITDHVGLQIGSRDYGTVEVPFTFHDPHDNTTGSGESEVTFSGVDFALLFGWDITRDVQVFARLGALAWTEDMESRFDLEGEPAMHRSFSESGTGPTFGAGLGWRFASEWRLVLQYERSSFDEDEMQMVSVGLAYDFLGLLRE